VILAAKPTLLVLAKTDPKTLVRAEAISLLSTFATSDPFLKPLFREAITARSYKVASAGLAAYLATGATDVGPLINDFENSKNEDMIGAAAVYFARRPEASSYQWFVRKLSQIRNAQVRYDLLSAMGPYLAIAPAATQDQALRYLENIARTDNNIYSRFGAFQAMAQLAARPEVATALRAIMEAETDPTLKAYYGLMMQ
jgi:aminopeptidase N